MKSILATIAVAFLMVAGNAFADGDTGPPHCTPPPFCDDGGSAGNSNNNENTNTNVSANNNENQNNNTNVSANNNENNNSANANAEGGRGGDGGTGVGIGVGVGQGGEGGSGTASSNSEGGTANSNSSSSSSSHSSANNNLSDVGNSNVRIEGDEAAASTARAPDITPTSPCTLVWSGAGQGMSFGVSLGGSVKDEECNKREAVRLGLESGHPEMTSIAFEVYKDLDAVKTALKDDDEGKTVSVEQQYGKAVTSTDGSEGPKSLP